MVVLMKRCKYCNNLVVSIYKRDKNFCDRSCYEKWRYSTNHNNKRSYLLDYNDRKKSRTIYLKSLSVDELLREINYDDI